MASTSIKEVAREAGVSVGTVSNVLNRPDLVAEQTRVRVLDAIERLRFVRNDSARSLRSGRTNALGLVVLDVANPFFTDVARSVEDVAGESGAVVILCNSDDSAAKQDRYLRVLQEQRVRGVLITPAHDSRLPVDELRERGVAVVLLDHTGVRDDLCSVAVDDVAGGRLAATHLVARGHREFAFVSGALTIRQCADRRQGMRESVQAAGLRLGPSVRDVIVPGMNARSGAEAARVLLASGTDSLPSAVFCANDLLAMGLMRELLRAGVRVPEDVAIVGYDDIEFAAASAVPITSIRQPTLRLGRTAAELLLDECDDPEGHVHRQVVFQPELVARESTVGPIDG
ncbi:LacI family DNA-binding transcriptional regulator [Streptomyces sp. SID3343]|uniref:LacI family DNA-binding transcriptional regulator n=1 Tax=Streptomyces sp. SID3343 TaxID=2690260 RepID=UPI00136C0C6D|nr:LacI family DNA-binding transcriptional regulator [Streptomyces sp. SID3343]MYV96920.1 substrate-binding domain-containing protein [Streptomyces sp. SID3343]